MPTRLPTWPIYLDMGRGHDDDDDDFFIPGELWAGHWHHVDGSMAHVLHQLHGIGSMGAGKWAGNMP